LASLLLDAADPELYDPERARQLAERACELTGWRDPMQMILLAEAEVQLGDAAEAVRIVDRALAVAEQGGAPASLRRALRAKRSEYAGKRTREGGSR
ncbi:MAG: hypothetical protein R3244_06940, partial [Thermoanaerobaculia bacterium]|nr:hypothetical protein [Thermoanaerobaculia bacterium]